ncbi:MAG: heavy metal translocating P-type ATPase metal-binding domain-containing protein [Methylococcaceae bacterium]
MSDTKKACDLCGLAVETPGFTLRTKEGDKAFCCEGCKGIYQLLNDDLIQPESEQTKLVTH